MMNIRLAAETDLQHTLQDGVSGFGFPAIIEDGNGNIIGNDVDDPFYCQVGRVHFFIDPDTGVGINGDFAHVAARIADLKTEGFNVDSGHDGWKVTTADINQEVRSYIVRALNPDHTLGLVMMICGDVTRDNAANEAIITSILGNMS
jgi:hypothetical protein